MRFELLTPNQFSEYSSNVDTLLVMTDTGIPLDAASPRTAAKLISQQLCGQVLERFRGRMTLLDAGFSLWQGQPFSDWAHTMSFMAGYQVKYGIVIAERLHLQEKTLMDLPDGQGKWLIFDWFQWLKQRVPEERLSDAFFYLSHATYVYWQSPEREIVGLSEADSQAMADEGERLLEMMANEIFESVTALWDESANSL
ncbi:hypothetical protein [Alicyclobacillus sp. SO9]|uniref:hypothetical protein n=1 Tax=Alicyclobacillus sp. SO9 TaxID=2665646 RepID=UPI0018E8575F|nr:hypothetical protein [Alicyclobacillus sp. SO9]QQE76791.1 hypothetical protein GI364_12250 [Alicyclobacillus sp. SO9]